MNPVQRAVSDLQKGFSTPQYYADWTIRDQAIYVSLFDIGRTMTAKCNKTGCKELCTALVWEGRGLHCANHNKCQVCRKPTAWANGVCFDHDQRNECKVCGEKTRWSPEMCATCFANEEEIMKQVSFL